MRKKSLALCAALLAGGLWSCAEKAPTARQGLEDIDPSGQKVSFWYQHSEEREDALHKLIDKFNRTNSYGIQVVGEHQGTHDDIYQQMLVRIQAGTPPPLLTAYRYQAQEYYRAGAVVDLKPYMSSPKWGLSEKDRSDYLEPFIDQDRIQGVQVAFLPQRSMEILYYNIDWMKELGYEGPPQNWSQFAEMCRKAAQQPFSRARQGSPGTGLALTVDASRLAAMVFSRGGDFADAEGMAYTLDTPAVRTSLGLLRELVQEGAARIVEGDEAARLAFAGGQALFNMRSSSGLPLYEADVKAGADFAWHVAPVPYEGSTPVLNVYGASLVVGKTTPEQQLAAWLFIKWFTDPEQQDDWAGSTHYFPVRKSVARQLSSYYRTAYDLLEYGRSEPWVVGYGAVRQMIEDAMVEVLGGGDMDAVLARLEQDANRTLK